MSTAAMQVFFAWGGCYGPCNLHNDVQQQHCTPYGVIKAHAHLRSVVGPWSKYGGRPRAGDCDGNHCQQLLG